MQSSLNSALRQETAFVSSPQPQRTLWPPWASQNPGVATGLYNFTLQSVGGAVFLQDCVPGAEPERGIHWQIENSATGLLHLTEFTVHGGALGPRITMDAAFQLFPALAATGTSDGRVYVACLLSNGYLMYTHLRPTSGSDTLLGGLLADALRPLDLTQHLAQLGTPTSLSATPEAVVVGGSSGAVLCVPLLTLEDGNTSRCFELRDSSWALTKLIPGVLYRPRQPAALACVPVTLAHRQLLLVSYDDSVLRVFNVARRQQVATLELEAAQPPSHAIAGVAANGVPGPRQQSAGSRHLVPTYIAAESPQYTTAAAAANGAASAGHGTSDVTLVVQFEAADTLSRLTYAYTLSSSSAGRLTLSHGTELAVETGGVVSEARVSGDTVWLLVKSQGRSKVLGFNRTSGAVVSSAVLAEAAGEHSSAAATAAGNGAEVDQELWEWLLQAFPDDLSAEGQVCQQVLVPGQTCRASLRDALSYHGAQFSASDVDSAPHSVLRSWIQASVLAAQRRTPSASAPECWHLFLATYRAAWARRHPPLGLVLHRGSAEWLGLARGGAVLCVLRRGTVVEALQGADAVAPLELPPHLNAVHRCSVEAGALLGPLVQEACLSLLVAGVDPLERLVPRLAELWHCGPASASGAGAGGAGTAGGPRASSGGAAGATRAAALTDSAREAQQRWRQRRQQLIISMGQRLGGLSDPASAVQSYLGLLRLMGSQAATELASASHGGTGSAGSLLPSRAASAFLVSTCRQVSRAAAAAARDAALLLGVIAQEGALGAAPLNRGSLVRLEAVLLPEACGLLRRSALGLWLTGTSSSQDEAADMEPALSALRHLRLGSPSSRRDRLGVAGASQRQQPAAAGGAAAGAATTASGDISLASRLLSAFCAAYARGRDSRLDLLDGAEAAGLLFTLYLQYGEQPSASLAARVLQLGYQLFQAGEYGNLAELAALAGATDGAAAGPLFLRGLGITCALALERQGASSEALHGGGGAGKGAAAARRAERIAEAAGCFFRAAASLASEAGETLRTILGDLRAELAGGLGKEPPPPTPVAAAGAPQQQPQLQQQRREVALLQLHFCEAVMQLFERERAPEGAVMFAAAALEHLRTAYGPTTELIVAGAPAAAVAAAAAPAVDPVTPLLPGEDKLLRDAAAAAAAERASREGRLWSNIYSYCVELRQYDRAYAALLANPLPAARLQSLRHLVHVLAQEGQLQTLCTLPFAGVAVLPVQQDGQTARTSTGGAGFSEPAHGSGSESGSGQESHRTVSLLSEALDLLHRRAHNCDLAESPQPYQVLYDFLVCRGDFKGAARAMAAYAWRLRAEAPSTEAAVAETLRAYDLATSCLSLLDPKDAWLDLTDPWLEKVSPHNRTQSAALLPGTAGSAGDGFGMGAAADGSLAGTSGASAGLGSVGRGAGQGPSAARRGPSSAAGTAPVATLQSLQRERTMLYYCAMVAARVAGLEPMRQWDNEDAILRQLLLMGRYEGALALVAGCYGAQGGDPWVRALEAVVSALAAHCARLQLQDGGVPTGGPALPPTDLFVDDPDGGAAASGLGAASAAAVAATLGGRAAPLWAKLRQLLSQMAEADAAVEQQGSGVRVGWLLRDAAAEAVLRTDPRVDLPQWLLDMFLADPSTGLPAAPAAMGSWACGPASLLSIYLRHDRLAAAVELVSAQVELWNSEDVLRRRRHCVAWMPYPQVELLHSKLIIAQQLGQERSGALLEQLDAAMAAHLDLIGADTEGLQASRVGDAGPSDSGPRAPLLLGPSTAASPAGTPSPLFGMGMAGGLRLFG